MPMRFYRSPLALFVALVVAAANVVGQSPEQRDRVAASFVLALGRSPTTDERTEWAKVEPSSFAELIARHREQLRRNPAAQRAVIGKAWWEALGRAPGEDEIAPSSANAGTYTELVQRQLRWLAERPAEYTQVLHRAYRTRLQREAYDLELDYWRQEGTLSFALLVACIDDWARRNQPGLMSTEGLPTSSVNSRYLTTVRLSPALAAEARAAAGLAPAGDSALAHAAGRNVVAAGAAGITSSGDIHFVAAGAADSQPGPAP